jgi:hypothetical protein
MDPHTYYLLQEKQVKERRQELPQSRELLTAPAGGAIPPCPRCGGTAVRHLGNSNYECQNGGSCHQSQFTQYH